MLLSRVVRAVPRSSTARCLRPPRLHTLRWPLYLSRTNQCRHASLHGKDASRVINVLRSAYKDHPYLAVQGIVLIGLGLFGFIWVAGTHYTKTVGDTPIIAFPDEVAKDLRRALYFANYEHMPARAHQHYQRALKTIHDMQLDPMQDPIIGLKVEIAHFMEKNQEPQQAVDILELVLDDCKRWLMERGHWPGKEGQRTRVLRKAVQISIKLSELYAGDYFLKLEKAEERLIWAVETAVKEEKRRKEEGVKEGEEDWLNADELGASFEALAHVHEKKDAHYLAAPLFLQAITLADPKSCHMAVLMNNLSTCLAQQQPPSVPDEAPTSRPALISNARAWSQKALQVAANISPPERNEECDISCAVATHNLAELAEMDGDLLEARKRYEEAKSLAKALKFTEGVINAENGLRRLSNR